MGRMTRELSRKADFALSNLGPGSGQGGLMNPEQEASFFRKMIDAPTILNDARTIFMTSPTREINKVGFGSRILKNALLDVTGGPLSAGAVPAPLTAANRSAPTTEKITLVTKEVIAQINIPYDVIEDNIEQANFTDTIVSMIAERAAVDIEELIISGDTTGAINDGSNFMKTTDGVLKKITSNASNANSATISKGVFRNAIKTMPTRFLRNRSALRFYVGVNNETQYRDTLADRQTGLGDSIITGQSPVYAFGVPVVPAALMPQANGLLIDPKNIIVGFHRRVQIETDKDIQARVWWIVLTMRLDIAIEEETAAVKIFGIS